MNIVINDFIGIQATHPISKTPAWNTDVVRYDSGTEQRNQILESPIRLWGMNWGILNQSQAVKAIELYNRAKGRYGTFQFRDPDEELGVSAETSVTHTVTSADNATSSFVVTGDIPEFFKDGVHFEVMAGANDGDWICDGNAVSDGVDTTVTTTIAPADEVASRNLQIQDYQLNTTYYSGESESWQEDRNELQNFAITDVDIVNETFLIAGQHASKFTATTKFIVTDSTGNDANWIVSSVARQGTDTLITVTGDITDATVDGTIILIEVTSNSIVQVPGTDYEIDENTGIVQFLNNQSPANGLVVAATYSYNFRVRFNSDAKGITEFTYHKYEFLNIELLEVKP